MTADYPPIFFLCTDPERALGLEKLYPNFHIICTDNTPLVDVLKNQGTKIYCANKEGVEQVSRSSFRLLKNANTQKYIEKHTPDNQTPYLMFFKIAPNIELLVHALGYKLLNTTASLNRRYENKLSQYKELSKANIKFPKTIIGKFKNYTYAKLAQELGNLFVMQYDRGHTGLGTIFINSPEGYENEKARYPNREVRFSKLIDGEPWTLNACVTSHGIAMGGLCYQVTGLPELTEYAGGTVGNDWSKKLPENVIKKVIEETEKIGTEMQKDGYQGLFGIDLIVDTQNDIHIIEVNARQPASVGMHTKLMLRDGLVPLSLMHIQQFMDTDINLIKELTDKELTAEFIKRQNKKAMQPIVASQLILRQMHTKSCKVTKPSGIFENSNWIKNGSTIEDLETVQQYLLIAQNEQTEIKAGYEKARIQAFQPSEFILEQFKKLIS